MLGIPVRPLAQFGSPHVRPKAWDRMLPVTTILALQMCQMLANPSGKSTQPWLQYCQVLPLFVPWWDRQLTQNHQLRATFSFVSLATFLSKLSQAKHPQKHLNNMSATCFGDVGSPLDLVATATAEVKLEDAENLAEVQPQCMSHSHIYAHIDR